MWFKAKTPVLGDFEQLVLLGVLRLEADEAAYGAAIRQEIHARSGRDVSINAVYTTLDRLEARGLVTSSLGDPTPERGGRAKRFFRVTAKGFRQARDTQTALTALWNGVPHTMGGEA